MAVNPALIGGGVVVAAAAVGGGLYAGGVFSGSGTSSSDNKKTIKQETKWRSLYEDKEFWDNTNKSSTYSGKWGDKYAWYLVGAGSNKKGAKETIDNSGWWEEKFKEFEKSKPQNGKFKDIISATTGNQDTKVLSKVCDAAYKANTSEVDTTNSDTTGAKYNESEIWKYCSPLGQKPTTVSSKNEATSYPAGIGKDTGNNSKLVSVKDSANDKFWKIKQKEVFAAGEPSSDSENYFKDFYNKNKSTNDELALKKKCGETYAIEADQNTSTADKPKKTEIVKYCSLGEQ